MSLTLNKKILSVVLAVLVCGYAIKLIEDYRKSVTSPTGDAVFAKESNNINAAEAATIKFFPLQEETVNIESPDSQNIEITFVSLSDLNKKIESRNIAEVKAETTQTDPEFERKVANVQNYLTKRGAPLASKARYLVQTAYDFGLDYRLVAAISIIESSGGKYCYRQYNAWGWGGAQGINFKSWEDAIYTISRGLALGYYARGAVTPEQIGPAYNPHTPQEWAAKVRYVMAEIGKP